MRSRRWPVDRQCELSSDELAERLIYAKQSITFVQANVPDAKVDDAQAIERWRRPLQHYGDWANAPVPLFPYPGSPDHTQQRGLPDERAWERAHARYLTEYAAFSDVQEDQPRPLSQLDETLRAMHNTPDRGGAATLMRHSGRGAARVEGQRCTRC